MESEKLLKQEAAFNFICLPPISLRRSSQLVADIPSSYDIQQQQRRRRRRRQ
jgi:hypothetical protein